MKEENANNHFYHVKKGENMTDEIMHTVIPNNSGWGGTALGAGVGGLIGSWLGGNGFGGFGGRGVSAGVGYDTGVLNGLSNQLSGLSNQINAADRDFLMQTSAQNQFLGNMINSGTDALAAAVNGSARDIQAGINQNTIAGIQASNAQNLAMCNGFGGVNAALSNGFGSLNLTVAEQGAQTRLQAQELAAQQNSCCCQVLRAIEQEGCANRELQREIQAQNIRDQLANSEAENQALKAQIFNINAMNAQTSAIINALKPATTTAGA